MFSKRIAGLSALALAAAPVAAAAHPTHPTHPVKPTTPNGKSHKCVAHPVAYRVSGTVSSASLTEAGKGKVNGTLTVTVSGSNKAAKNAGATKGSSQSYTLTGAKATYAHKVTKPNPAEGTRVVVKGTITVAAKKCQSATGTGTVTIKRVSFTPAPKRK